MNDGQHLDAVLADLVQHPIAVSKTRGRVQFRRTWAWDRVQPLPEGQRNCTLTPVLLINTYGAAAPPQPRGLARPARSFKRREGSAAAAGMSGAKATLGAVPEGAADGRSPVNP